MQTEVPSGIRHPFECLFQSQGQVAHVLLTRSPLVYPRRGLTVRLACVKHAASVRPEPGSNSPLKTKQNHQHESDSQQKRKPEPKAQAPQFNQKSLKETTHPNPTSHPQKKGDHQNPGTGSFPNKTLALTIKHAVEFSRSAHTPATPTQPGRNTLG